MTPTKFSNRELAATFQTIADLLQIKGEVIYKILAYRKAADSLKEYRGSVYNVWQEGELTDIPGVGKAIAEKIDELFSTGQLEFLNKLSAEVPPSLADLLQVPDLGPKKVALFWKELGITDLAGLEAAARAGELRGLPGMGEKSEAKILAGIESLARRTTRTPLWKAWPEAERILSLLKEVPGVVKAVPGGSLRRPLPPCRKSSASSAAGRPSPALNSTTACAPSCGCIPPIDSAPPCSMPPGPRITMYVCVNWL
jgi:DNA polymerase (family 10)